MENRGSGRRRIRRAVARSLLAGVLAVGLGTLAAIPGHAGPVPDDRVTVDPPAAKPSKLTLNVTQTGPGTVSVTGRVTTTDGQPVTGTVLVTIDGRPLGVVATGADGSYGVKVPGIPDGRHTAQAMFVGGMGSGETAKQDFVVKPGAQGGQQPPTGGASGSEASAGAAVITAKVTPTTATPGGYIDISGTLRSGGNVPINQARIEISTSWGDVTGAAATSASGAFSASLALPALPAGQAPPTTMTVTVAYPGDGPYAATNTMVRVAMKAPDPTPPPPTIKTEANAPAVEKAAKTAASAAPAAGSGFDLGGAASRGVAVLVIALAVGAVTVLAAMAAVAWRRHRLLPDERRGFGTDFGQ